MMYIHHVPRLVRKQIYVTAEQEEMLKAIAARERRSEADVIRAALDERLKPRPRSRRRVSNDSLWGIVAAGASEARDVSTQVDHYLYGASRR
jgi:hypothetical protein